MRRRRYLTVGFGLTATVIGGPGATTAVEDDLEEPDPIGFEGDGATVTDAFTLEGGVTIVEAVHDGESNFVVELVPTDGDRRHLLVNVIGDFDGAAGVLVDDSEYLLDVDADGAWALEVLQPRATADEAESLPVTLDGASPTWAGPLRFDGLGTATGSHDGQGNFIVEVLLQDDHFPALVFNELDSFEGETTFTVEGVGYVTVDAAGPWTLTLE